MELCGPMRALSMAPAVPAGMQEVMRELQEALQWPLRFAGLASMLGVRWPSGILLHGPSGCGKTLAVRSLSTLCGAAVHMITATSIIGAFTGESERRLREAFDLAAKDAATGRPVVIFLDEIDALCPKRSTARQHEARIVGQLLTLLDGTSALNPTQLQPQAQEAARPGHILVIGATSRPNAVDPALRRPGRLEKEILVTMPDAAARASILKLLAGQLPLDSSVDVQQIALECHGYTGADLQALCREAAMYAITTAQAAGAAAAAVAAADSAREALSVCQQGTAAGPVEAQPVPATKSVVQPPHSLTVGPGPGQPQQGRCSTLMLQRVTAEDFAAAMTRVGPSMARGSAVEFEAISWDDIGGLEHVKLKLRQAVEWPLRHADAFQRLGLASPRGVLLHGPPGCSKTTLVRAAATVSGATFISLSGAQLYSMYVGEGEALLRETFRRARLVSPSIVFFDELDSLVGKRVEGEQTNEVTSRILSSFLTEMDGLELAQGVLVMGATNRPQALDAALIRPGRFDVVLYVPPPDHFGRVQALQIHSRSMPLAPGVDLAVIASQTEVYTGAELAAVCREAGMTALREGATEVEQQHFLTAVQALRPQLTLAELTRYENWHL